MRQLYVIRSEYLAAVEMMENATTPEEVQAANDALAAISEDFETKIENIRRVILNREGEAQIIKAEEDWHKSEIARLKERRESIEGTIAGLKDYTAREMNTAGIRKVKTPFMTAFIRKNRDTVEVMNDEKIPIKFYIPQPSKLDKDSLLAYIKAGNEIEGCKVKFTESLIFDTKKAEADNE